MNLTPEHDGITHQTDVGQNFIERILGIRGNVSDLAMFPSHKSATETAMDDGKEVVSLVDELLQDGTIDGQLLAFRYGTKGQLTKDLYLHPDKTADILLTVYAPSTRDYKLLYFHDDEFNPLFPKRVPLGISENYTDFLDISLTAPGEPHSILLTGKESLQRDFILSTALFANEIDTVPTGKPTMIDQYLLAPPSQGDELYKALFGLSTFSQDVHRSHPRTHVRALETTRESLLNLRVRLSEEPYYPLSGAMHHIIYVKDIDRLFTQAPKLMRDVILPWFEHPDPRVHIIATSGFREKMTLPFDLRLYGESRRERPSLIPQNLRYTAENLPPHQFTFWGEQGPVSCWVPKSTQD